MSYGNAEPPPFQQRYPAPKQSGQGAGWIILIVVAVVSIPVLLMCMGILIGLLLPAVQAAREAARRMQCTNNVKQIALALHNYESVFRSLPPAYTVDSAGRPLHSWRTLILPYIEQKALYDQIDLSRPWNDPVNLPFSQINVPAYHCPSVGGLAAGHTCYQVVVDPTGIFSGSTPSKFSDVKDGLSNTILVIEVDDSQALPWMEPQDTNLAAIAAGGQSNHVGGYNTAMADGSIQFMQNSMAPQNMKAFVSKAAGDSVAF
jgi:type II secretory pathway pseudopilin PulG